MLLGKLLDQLLVSAAHDYDLDRRLDRHRRLKDLLDRADSEATGQQQNHRAIAAEPLGLKAFGTPLAPTEDRVDGDARNGDALPLHAPGVQINRRFSGGGKIMFAGLLNP